MAGSSVRSRTTVRAVDRERRSSSSHTSSPSTLVPSMLSSDAKPNVSEKESGMPEYGSAGGVGEAVRRALAARPDLPLSVEVRDGAEIEEAVGAGAPRLLLDNMTPQEVVAAVALVAGRAELEVSGGVTPDSILVYATIDGLDYVSMGALTHSAPVLDLGVDLRTL